MCVVAKSFAAGQLSQRQQMNEAKTQHGKFVLFSFNTILMNGNTMYLICCIYENRIACKQHPWHSSLNQLDIEMCQKYGYCATFIRLHFVRNRCFFATVVRPPLNIEIHCFFFALLNNIVLPSILNRITRTENRSVLTHTLTPTMNN